MIQTIPACQRCRGELKMDHPAVIMQTYCMLRIKDETNFTLGSIPRYFQNAPSTPRTLNVSISDMALLQRWLFGFGGAALLEEIAVESVQVGEGAGFDDV